MVHAAVSSVPGIGTIVPTDKGIAHFRRVVGCLGGFLNLVEVGFHVCAAVADIIHPLARLDVRIKGGVVGGHGERGGALCESLVIIPAHRFGGGIHNHLLIIRVQVRSAGHAFPHAEHTGVTAHTFHEDHMEDISFQGGIQSHGICHRHRLRSAEIGFVEFVLDRESCGIGHRVPRFEGAVLHTHEFRARNHLAVLDVFFSDSIIRRTIVFGHEEEIGSNRHSPGDTIFR